MYVEEKEKSFNKVSKLIADVYNYDRENSEKIDKILEAITWSNCIEELEQKLKRL